MGVAMADCMGAVQGQCEVAQSPRSFPTYCVRLELRPLPSTGVTQLQRCYEPLRHPKAPGLSLAGFQLVVALTTPWGFPCCVRFPCVHAVATTPAQRLGVLLRSFTPSRISLPRKGGRVGLRIVLFEACSAFTRVTACTLALSPIRDTLSEGFSHFVTSIAAPAASGWSVAGWDLHPLESAALSRGTPNSDIGREFMLCCTTASQCGRLGAFRSSLDGPAMPFKLSTAGAQQDHSRRV